MKGKMGGKRGRKILIPKPPKAPKEAHSKSPADNKKWHDKQIDHLADRLEKNYSIHVDKEAMKSIDFKSAKEAMESVENVAKNFSATYSFWKDQGGVSLRTTNSNQNFYARAALYQGYVEANKKYFSNGANLNSSYARDLKTGFHPANTKSNAIIAHETGHLLVTGYAANNNINLYGSMVDVDRAAKDILEKARKIPGVKNYFKRNGISLNATKKQAGLISGYAIKSNHETIAEAVADYYANGSRANIYSRAIVRVLKGK
ncbi:MAG: hypothetical protein MR707_08475 [Galactobacillus timonensis]|uniref:hypothetical protein n=1 Tax=Galactobacillus timonensis TaxID=2041840 RepID=UPI0023F46D6A|nr:hypothetical protein [Galactobacillus timonensis]MCI6068241.1 hypothetical protein [Galactobacillus timonensis]